MKLDVYKLLSEDLSIRIKISPEFRKFIRERVTQKFTSLSNCSRKLGRSRFYLQNWFREKFRCDMSLAILSDICKRLDIPEEKLFDNIEYFSLKGGHKIIKFPRFIEINKEFVEGYSLYIGDGATSYSSHMVFTNSYHKLIIFFVEWFVKYFGAKKEFLLAYIDTKRKSQKDFRFLMNLGIPKNKIKFRIDPNYNKTLFRIICPVKIYKKLFHNLLPPVKELALNNNFLAKGYLQGIFAAEGHAYYNEKLFSRGVDIEMKNLSEIEFISKLLHSFNVLTSKIRSVKHKSGLMWKINIYGHEELQKVADLNIFGRHEQRQQILKNGIKTYRHFQNHRKTANLTLE